MLNGGGSSAQLRGIGGNKEKVKDIDAREQ